MRPSARSTPTTCCRYAVGTINFTGDMPIFIGRDGPSLGGFVCNVTVAQAEMWKMGQVIASSSHLLPPPPTSSHLLSPPLTSSHFLTPPHTSGGCEEHGVG